ncbi:hypothetical protein [Bradyrhizobium sp. SYSU BS000235]|uniref:hypothetical protein n=1 Tax=Bradyrhizobium sp. SYSU BS000235 TaxID=3411332 RepID=UPI003C794ECD
MSGSIKHRVNWIPNPSESSGLLTLLSVVLAVPAALIIYSLDMELILPAFSVLLFSGAAISVVLACSVRTETNPEKLTLWDVAGGLVLTGCAASVLGEPDQVTQLFEHLFERRTNTQ